MYAFLCSSWAFVSGLENDKRARQRNPATGETRVIGGGDGRYLEMEGGGERGGSREAEKERRNWSSKRKRSEEKWKWSAGGSDVAWCRPN